LIFQSFTRLSTISMAGITASVAARTSTTRGPDRRDHGGG
jgi:hypothetical protein